MESIMNHVVRNTVHCHILEVGSCPCTESNKVMLVAKHLLEILNSTHQFYSYMFTEGLIGQYQPSLVLISYRTLVH